MLCLVMNTAAERFRHDSVALLARVGVGHDPAAMAMSAVDVAVEAMGPEMGEMVYASSRSSPVPPMIFFAGLGEMSFVSCTALSCFCVGVDSFPTHFL